MKPLSISLRSLDVLAEPPMRTRLRVAAASWRRVAVCLIACYSLGLWFATLSVGAEPAIPALTGQETIRVKSGDNSYVGRSMFEGYSGLTLLRRNGRIKSFKPDEIDQVTTIAPTFEPQTAREMRVSLQKEFGSKYEVSLTRHFLVVHPPGAYQRWALPFEQIYIRFRQWFSSRGMRLEHPEFPMVAIVLTSRREYDRFSQRYTNFHFNTVGYYNSLSNRMITYDTDNGRTKTSTKTADATMETIVHETVHQVAHNVGIHNRAFAQPLWFKEGLASTFEAPGVNNPAQYPRKKDRVNVYRYTRAKRYLAANQKPGLVASLIRNDQLFRVSPDAGYALSWALTSYLVETQPLGYTRFVKATNEASQAGKRKVDPLLLFQEAFGPVNKVEGGLRSYVASLKID